MKLPAQLPRIRASVGQMYALALATQQYQALAHEGRCWRSWRPARTPYIASTVLPAQYNCCCRSCKPSRSSAQHWPCCRVGQIPSSSPYVPGVAHSVESVSDPPFATHNSSLKLVGEPERRRALTSSHVSSSLLCRRSLTSVSPLVLTASFSHLFTLLMNFSSLASFLAALEINLRLMFLAYRSTSRPPTGLFGLR